MSTLFLLLAAGFQVAPQYLPKQPTKAPIIVRGSTGKIVATATPKGNTIVLRDARGRLTGTLEIKGKSVQAYDSLGRRK